VKLLLDTHIWLWYLLGDERLSTNLQTVIAEETTELWLSPISIWETLIIAEKGRISLQPDAVAWIDLALQTLEILEAPLVYQIAILSRTAVSAPSNFGTAVFFWHINLVY
jgi:PIN domain nuclease of toxin-antitoxin system